MPQSRDSAPDPSQTAPTLSDCLLRVRAAEEALADVRQALERMGNMSGAVKADSSELKQVSSTHTGEGSVARVTSSGNESQQLVSLPSIPTLKASDNALPSTKKIGSFCSHHELEDMGGAEEVSKKFGISPVDAENAQRAFASCDVEGVGKVNSAELNILMEEACGMSFSDTDIKKLLAKFDKDRTGDLTFEEFLLLFCETPLNKASDLDNHISRVGQEIRQQMEDERTTPSERVDGLGVSGRAITTYLRTEIAEAGACIQMPVAFLMLFCFCLSVLVHMRIEELHAVDTAITWDLHENANFAFSGAVPFDNGRMGHKNLEDVNSIADFWSWFSMGLVPLFWPEGWDVSEMRTNIASRCRGMSEYLEYGGYNKSVMESMLHSEKILGQNPNGIFGGVCPEDLDPATPLKESWGANANMSYYLFYHTILGGMRMQQEAVVTQECPSTKETQDAMHAGACLEDLGYWLEPELRTALLSRSEYTNMPGSETKYLLSRTPQKEVIETLRALENKAWFNPGTAKVELMFTTYNSHMNLLTATYILFFLNRAGHIHKIVEPVCLWLRPYQNWWDYVPDIAWFSVVTFIFLHESHEIVRHCRQLGACRGWTVYFSLSNIVDWISIMYSFVIVAFWVWHLQKLDTINALINRADASVVGSWREDKDRIDFYDTVGDAMYHQYNFRALLAYYPFVIVFRLFKAFALQPRLAIVTNTLSQASTDIVHFAVIFGSIFIIYATSAMILFGQEIIAFANFGRSLSTIFRILLGDFEWEELTRIGRTRANLWFGTFIWLVQLTMLNMLLAIVMDVYTEVKGSMGNRAETLWSQAVEIYQRGRAVYSGRELHLMYILKCLDPHELDADDDFGAEIAFEFYTVSRLCQVVPGLPEEQARSILIASQEMLEDNSRASTSLTDTALTIQKMASLVWKLHAAVQQLFHMSELNAQLTINATSAGRSVDRRSSMPDTRSSSKQPSPRPVHESKNAYNQELAPSLQVLSSVLESFRRQHRETEDLLSRYGEQLTRNQGLSGAVPELQHPPERPLWPPKKKDPVIFPGICPEPSYSSQRRSSSPPPGSGQV